MAIILGLDQGIYRTGFCVGDGAGHPLCGAWRFPEVREDIGELGAMYRAAFGNLYDRTRFTHVIYEAPFLDRYRDKVIVLRKRFGIDMLLETMCKARHVTCEETPWARVKREMTDNPSAKKGDMVAVAEKIGIVLPHTKTAGKEDAADAVALWLMGVRLYARQHLAAWDQRRYRARGAMV